MSHLSFVTIGAYARKHSCGYCGSEDTSKSFGFYAPLISVETYEAMLNRGWRRSGKYMYKPDLKNTCCRLYAIRMEATKFKSRREHRKDVHRFNRYIKGETWDTEISAYQNTHQPQSPLAKQKLRNEFDLLSSVHAAESSVLLSTPHPPHLLPDHTYHLELDTDTITPEKFALYAKYQRLIHHEQKREITREQFKRFLCSSPLRPANPQTLGERKTGTVHQLYRVDGVLVAFAVLDLLPQTVSSVYFVYDPEVMGKFGMGKVSACREVAMCVEGGYKYYGLGLFAHGCEKLRYKGEMQPSELLDPETYEWHPFEKFKSHFDNGDKYVTFNVEKNEPPEATSSTEVDSSSSDDSTATVASPLEEDRFLFTNGPTSDLPYDPHLDPPFPSGLFSTDMPGVHSRAIVINAEGFWAKYIFVREDGELRKYLNSNAVKSPTYREEVREMVAILGRLIFEMVIWIS